MSSGSVAAPNTFAPLALPPWACAGDKRAAHIARVTALLDQWAVAMDLNANEATAWHDAGRWHDALRDADPESLRNLVEAPHLPDRVLHAPAAAIRLAEDGEARHDVLEAIRWHPVGHVSWSRAGRALYMADFLEPGRPFAIADRAFLAARVPTDFDGVFRQVVRLRIEWVLREGKALMPETVALWNSVR